LRGPSTATKITVDGLGTIDSMANLSNLAHIHLHFYIKESFTFEQSNRITSKLAGSKVSIKRGGNGALLVSYSMLNNS